LSQLTIARNVSKLSAALLVCAASPWLLQTSRAVGVLSFAVFIRQGNDLQRIGAFTPSHGYCGLTIVEQDIGSRRVKGGGLHHGLTKAKNIFLRTHQPGFLSGQSLAHGARLSVSRAMPNSSPKS